MMKLEDWKMSDVLNYYVGYIIDECGMEVSKAEAKKLIINALTYNVVREAVVEQVEFLVNNDED